MTIVRYLIFLGLAFSWPCWLYADSSPPSQQVLQLDFKNNGQHLVASVGERIELFLGLIGPEGAYGDPQISSAAVRLISKKLPPGPPPPGGAFYVYTFKAAAEGKARIRFPVVNAPSPQEAKLATFTVTIRVRKS